MNGHGTPLNNGDQAFITARLVTAVPAALRDMDPQRIIQVLKDGAALDQSLNTLFKQLLGENGATVAAAVNPTYSISVNYALALKAMVKVGKFDWVNDNITEKNFRHDKKRGAEEVVIELVKFDTATEGDTVVAEMDKRGMRPATVEELCAFGAKYPDIQRQFPVVALGSPWVKPDGYRYVPYLRRDGTGRFLSLGWWGGRWFADYRFAAVRK